MFNKKLKEKIQYNQYYIENVHNTVESLYNSIELLKKELKKTNDKADKSLLDVDQISSIITREMFGKRERLN